MPVASYSVDSPRQQRKSVRLIGEGLRDSGRMPNKTEYELGSLATNAHNSPIDYDLAGYSISCLLTSLTQVPFILLLYYLMQKYRGLLAVDLIYFISVVQVVTVGFYLRNKGFFFLDVPYDSRKMLVARSFLHGLGFLCFIHSLRFVSPVTALCAQGTTVVMNTCLVRLPRALSR